MYINLHQNIIEINIQVYIIVLSKVDYDGGLGGKGGLS
jgi:hypothetical protein